MQAILTIRDELLEHLARQRLGLELLQLGWQLERPDDELRV